MIRISWFLPVRKSFTVFHGSRGQPPVTWVIFWSYFFQCGPVKLLGFKTKLGLHSASHAVLDLVALTCLTSWMRGVPCSFYLGSTYALTLTSQCTNIPLNPTKCNGMRFPICWDNRLSAQALGSTQAVHSSLVGRHRWHTTPFPRRRRPRRDPV